MPRRLTRAALFALALCTPASAATVNDLTVTLIDGRPVFRPADGLDCYTAKFGGIPIDCALADAALMRPRRAPCWLRPDLVGPCPVGKAVLAALPAAPSVLPVAPAHSAGRTGWTGGTGSCCGTRDPYDPPPVAPVPLPAGGALLLAALLMAGLMIRKRSVTNG
jgi:hypothetical protein